MKVFNRHADMHKICWEDYSHQQRFAVVTAYLKEDANQLKTIVGQKQAEYYTKVMSQNHDLLQAQISYKLKELAEMQQKLAMYDEYAKQLKELY